LIRRRSSQQKGKDNRRETDAPTPFFNLTDDSAPAEEGPLFNMEELHERRILSWSPEPEEFFEEGPQGQVDAEQRPEPSESERYELPEELVVAEQPYEPPTLPAVSAAPEAPVRVVTQPVASAQLETPTRPARTIPPPLPASVESTEEPAARAEEHAPKRRGRPRGRPRRQVHFHVDPDEERLLMAAAERYGSQQKGLIAALESLQEAEVLRDEIERLRAETARHRRLLDEAESLFNR
jgi:uncharacterized small protein (DUF1192 family)